MNYGTTAYGSTAYGGAAVSERQVFFPYQFRDDGVYEVEADLSLSDLWFSVFLRKSGDTASSIEIFTRNDPGETPQSQGVSEGASSQSVIASARFIKVVLTVNGITGDNLEVYGRAGQ